MDITKSTLLSITDRKHKISFDMGHWLWGFEFRSYLRKNKEKKQMKLNKTWKWCIFMPIWLFRLWFRLIQNKQTNKEQLISYPFGTLIHYLLSFLHHQCASHSIFRLLLRVQACKPENRNGSVSGKKQLTSGHLRVASPLGSIFHIPFKQTLIVWVAFS